MRDERRIDRVLEIIGDYWKLVPDWRFGQLMYNVFKGKDIFYLEEEELIKEFNKFFNTLPTIDN